MDTPTAFPRAFASTASERSGYKLDVAPNPVPSKESPFASIADLKESLALRPAAVHLGAGISIALSGQAISAKAFHGAGLDLALEQGLIDEVQFARNREMLDSADPDDQSTAAGFIEAKLRPRPEVFETWLRSTIGGLTLADTSLAGPLTAAARAGLILSTTNYDHVLGEATGLPTRTWQDFRSVDQLRDPPTILHLDGLWDVSESLVLVVRRDEKASSHREAIQSFLAPLRFLVLVGVGPTFFQSTLCQQIRNRGGTLPGALVCRQEDVDFFASQVAEHLHGFRLVPFPGGFGALPGVLEDLFGTIAGAPEPRPRVTMTGGPVFALAYSSTGNDLLAGLGSGGFEWVDLTQHATRYRPATKNEGPVWTLTQDPVSQVFLGGTEDGEVFALVPGRPTEGRGGRGKRGQGADSNLEVRPPSGVRTEMPSPEGFPVGSRGIWDLAYSATVRQLAIARDSGHLELCELRTHPERIRADGLVFTRTQIAFAHSQGALAVAFSPDGRTLASAGHDRAIRFWSVPDLKPLRALEGHEDWVGSIAYSPDGATLASTGGDKTVILWDLDSGKPRWRAQGHTEWVQSLSFHPSGAFLATGSWDKSVRIWAAADGRPLTELLAHTDRVWTVAFSPDGRWLASGSDDRTIRLWPIDVDHLNSVDRSRPDPIPLSPEFRSLAESPDRLARFLARVTHRHREGFDLLETLEPGKLSDLLRHANVLAADSAADFGDRLLNLDRSLASSFEPPPLWLAWMQHVRGVELHRLGRELISLAERTLPPPRPTSPTTPSPETVLAPAESESAASSPREQATAPVTQQPPARKPRRKARTSGHDPRAA